MWFSRRARSSSPRPRRTLFLVEQLEKRELLSGSPLPAAPQRPPTDPFPALAGTLAVPPANALLPGYAPPGGSSGGAAWQSVGSLVRPPTAAKAPLVHIPLVIGPNQSATPDGEGYTPAQLRQAYGFDRIALPAGQTFDDAGAGQTIAIIDGLNDPYLTADLQHFDETFNIGGAAHNPTSTSFFKVVNENGGTDLPPTDNGAIDYGLETSLDVQWAHAMAPGANILVVEISTPFDLNDLGTAIEYAARQPGVSVVSMSFGYGDGPQEYYLDSMFTTPPGHAGVSFVASAGDSGGTYANYPAISANVLGVGGTTLPADGSGNPDRSREYAWTGGGGGVATGEAEPAYQLGVQSTGWRNGPDLAYDSDQATGVAVYDTLYANAQFPGKPWFKVGGTSIAAPQISSLVAIADQQRVAAGEATLDGARQLIPAIYQIAARDPNAFRDITAGNNGNPAGPGYDLATGLGTPNAQYLVPDLVAAAATPPAPTTLYWTGAVDTNWNTPGNWSAVDPRVATVPQSVLPAFNTDVVIDRSGATILHDAASYDTIRSLTVTAPNVALDLGAGTLDLSGGGGRGRFQVDQPGDAVTMGVGILAGAVVTAGTTLSATSAPFAGFYPELAGVEVDGTVNANQSGGNNGIIFQYGLILNGTINLGGTSDLSAVLLAGTIYQSNQDNNPETISGHGTIQFGQSQNGDAIYNWGTLGTLTIGPGITVRGGGPGSLGAIEQTTGTGGIDNQGTIVANGGTLVIQAFAPAFYGWVSSASPASTVGWTNEGTITATGATLALLGGWANGGTIRADATSTLLLGSPTSGDTASSPNAAYESWGSTGSITVGDGATVYVGGFLTTDAYQGAAPLPGVTIHPALDSLVLYGTLDNSAADNAVTRGVLAVSAATGPLKIAGGTIDNGRITTSGSADVEVFAATPLPTFQPAGFPTGLTAAGGWLYRATNTGTINAIGSSLVLQAFTNNGTISGTAAYLDFASTWANHGTIRVDAHSTLSLGAYATTDPSFPPSLADASAYAWDFGAVGTLAVADGATLILGGLMTSDQFAAFPTLPGVSVHLAQDTVKWSGWLDNKPADNPIHGGVLALTAATGTLIVNNGYIAGGTITSSAAGGLTVANGVLDGITSTATIDVPAFYSLILAGNVINNGTLAADGGRVTFLPGGSFTNNGSLTLATNSFVAFESDLINHGTITATRAGLSVVVNGPPVSLTNAGSITLSSGYLFVTANITNTGTVSAATNSSVLFYDNYDNSHGTVTIDATSGMVLGYSPTLQQNFPTFADGKPYTFNPAKVGTLKVADGATFDIGGLLTTDQWNAFPRLPGVSINPAKDHYYLAGWLDNSPADNPRSHGTLALTPATGVLYLNGGYIYQGKITTSGTNDLEASSIGELDGVELDGNLNVSGRFGFGEIFAVNNFTVNGTVAMPQEGQLLVGNFDNAADVISGTGTIALGTADSFECVLVNLSNNSLTIGPGITINAGARFADLVSETTQINVQGTVIDNTASSTLYTYGVSHETGAMFQDLANYRAGTLAGGTWQIGNGATWRLDGADFTTNAANLSLRGAGTRVLDAIFDAGSNALAGLTTNAAAGSLTVGAGYRFTVPGAFANAGVLDIEGGGSVNVQGDYTQASGGALVIGIADPATFGQLTVAGTASLAGALQVTLSSGYRPAAGTWFPILTFGARSGDFSTEMGLAFSQSRFFVSAYVGNHLDLVTGPGVTVVAGTDLFLIGGLTSNDQVQIKAAGTSKTGSTGVQVTATLNGVTTATTYALAFGAIHFVGYAGNDNINLGSTLTINAIVSAGNGNDAVTLGDGNNVVTLGNGNDTATAGNGNNLITLGNGNDSVTAGNGNNLITLGNGNDATEVGNGNNVVVAGNGNDSVTADNGNNLITLGNGNDVTRVGNGNNVVTLGNGNDTATAGDGNNTITLGNGNDVTRVGNGNNVVVEGNGNDSVTAGNGTNLIVAGLGKHTVRVGNGTNILIDGSLQLTQPGDSLRQVLDDWIHFGSLAANVAGIRSRLAVTYNSSNANTLQAGSGLDWFWVKYAKDLTNRKPNDLLD